MSQSQLKNTLIHTADKCSIISQLTGHAIKN